MRVVNFAGPASLIGQFVDVRVTQAMSNSLRGRLLSTADNTGLALAANA
jgi:tRNA-2-methylthio-N6-dimethylallyladenosine synthase